jgi:hypothetical protein
VDAVWASLATAYVVGLNLLAGAWSEEPTAAARSANADGHSSLQVIEVDHTASPHAPARPAGARVTDIAG